MRTCTKCQVEQPLEEFGTGTRRSRCRACIRQYAAARYQRTKADRLEWERWAHLRKKYRLSQEQYAAMLAGQGGGCAICKSPSSGGRGSFHVDHDHACCSGTGSCGSCIRGLLCLRCNTGIGSFRDAPELLRAAALYLRSVQSAQSGTL